MYYLFPKALDRVNFFRGYIVTSVEDTGEARVEGECEEINMELNKDQRKRAVLLHSAVYE
jgi:hypothetical protein